MMSGSGRYLPAVLAALAWIAVVQVGAGTAGETTPANQLNTFDCGTIALHNLLSLEGRATHIEKLGALLPVIGAKGHSMAELRDAARACGLVLIGVRLRKRNHAPDRPALVYLQREDHGHFLVVRPVGHSGRLIQVIDLIGDPVVMDATDLYASNQWTGLALVPVRPNWPLRIAAGLMIIFGCSLVLLLATVRYRAAKVGESGVRSSAGPARCLEADRLPS
jgi:hypothetical protein